MLPAPRVPADAWIVVVNWNGAHLLRSCLASLSRLTRPAHVAVVDNGSSDDSAEVVGSFPDVEWIPLGRNIGFAAANNVGIRLALAAGARWVAIANTDVQVEPDWLERLVEAGDAHPEAGLLGGLLLFEHDPARVNSTGLTLDVLGRARDRDFGVPVSTLETRDGPVTGVSGGAALYRAEALRRIGLFDPAYFAYYEDVDLSLRAAALGIRSWYVSAARARHGYGRSFGNGSPRQRYLLASNHMRAVATHQPLARVLAIAPAVTALRTFLKAPLELVRGRPAYAAAHLRAAFAGILAVAEILPVRLSGHRGCPRGAEP
jgi:GT2 family glycosyltransferase